MQSFTAMSPEGIKAVKEAMRDTGVPYRINLAGDWTEDYATLRHAIASGANTLGVDESVRVDLLEDLMSDNGFYLSTKEFDTLVDLLALLAESDEQMSHRAASFLSAVAETLGVEFI